MPDKGKGDIQEVCKVTGGKLCSCLEFCIGRKSSPKIVLRALRRANGTLEPKEPA